MPPAANGGSEGEIESAAGHLDDQNLLRDWSFSWHRCKRLDWEQNDTWAILQPLTFMLDSIQGNTVLTWFIVIAEWLHMDRKRSHFPIFIYRISADPEARVTDGLQRWDVVHYETPSHRFSTNCQLGSLRSFSTLNIFHHKLKLQQQMKSAICYYKVVNDSIVTTVMISKENESVRWSKKPRTPVRWQPEEPFPSDSVGVIWLQPPDSPCSVILAQWAAKFKLTKITFECEQ